MKYQYLQCLQCKKVNPDYSTQCIFCKGVYSLLYVVYPFSKKVTSIQDLYTYLLPFKLFKKKDFMNCSLSRYEGNIWIKNEGENKSKSVKEKDIFVGLKVANYLKYKKTCLVSSGSGIDVARYFVQKHKIPLILYSPVKTEKKISNQINMGKDYEDTFRYLLKVGNKQCFNITPGINPYSQEGAKVISWQLISSHVSFDIVTVPCGNGSTLWSLYRGFVDAFSYKLVDRIPAFYSVELINGPILRSFKSEKLEKNKSVLDSKAKSIDVKESFCLQKALYAIKMSGGGVGYATEEEIENAYRKLHKKGISALFTATASLAMAKKLNKKFPHKKICAILTGSE